MSMHALALPESRSGRSLLYGTRAQIASTEGDVQGHLALAGCDSRAGTASYALRIVNQSQYALRARMMCARMRGEMVLGYPLDVQIAPFSISETLLPVRVAEIGPYDRAIVQVAGGDVAFSLEAPAPPTHKKRSRLLAFATAAIMVTLGAGLAAATATPRISAIAAPSRVYPGSTLDVPYEFGGLASMQYSLKTRDGRQLFAGLVRDHEGTLHFNVPGAAGEVVLAENVSGLFGTRSAQQSISISPSAPRPAEPKALQTPHISEFAVVTPVVHANGELKLTYATNARQGEIWLIDESGRLWARAPINSSGETSLQVPQGAAGRSMRATLHALIGSNDAVASVGLTVLPDAVVSNSPEQPVAKSAAVKIPPAALTLSTDNAAPGEMITVAIDGRHGDTEVSLNDASGNAIEQGDIPAGQSAVVLTAPNVTTATSYYIMANVTQGVGEQTLVKKLTVSPR